MRNYNEFLKTKLLKTQPSGFDVSADDIHDSLFPFQKDLVRWSVRKGRCINAASTGLGKTRMFLETARLWGEKTLIIAPLVTIGQTIREAHKIDIHDIVQVRSMDTVRAHANHNLFITNYEMIHHFDFNYFGTIIADEISIIKHEGGKYRKALVERSQDTKYLLGCTATPAPNDVKELGNYAEWLGIMTMAEMKSAFFINRTTKKVKKAGKQGWSLRGWAEQGPFYQWLASWCMAVNLPSDLGYNDDGFVLPPMDVEPVFIESDYVPDGQLMFTSLKGVGHRAAVRRATLSARVNAVVDIMNSSSEHFVAWCGLNDESKMVAEKVNGAIEVTGSQSPEEKACRLDEFLQGKHRVLVTKTKIAGFGMNLQEVCHNQTFVGFSDSWESYRHAWARLRRFGQKHRVKTWIVLADVEDAIYHNVMRKAKQAETMNMKLIEHVAQYRHDELVEVAQNDIYNPLVAFRQPVFLRGDMHV
jgi:hypothetical protein